MTGDVGPWYEGLEALPTDASIWWDDVPVGADDDGNINGVWMHLKDSSNFTYEYSE